jgi:hypothetical protein
MERRSFVYFSPNAYLYCSYSLLLVIGDVKNRLIRRDVFNSCVPTCTSDRIATTTDDML